MKCTWFFLLRFHPKTWHKRIGMRAAVLGCRHTGDCGPGFMRVNTGSSCGELTSLKHSLPIVTELNRTPGMVTIEFQSELPTCNKGLESSLVLFLTHDFLDSCRQQRAFWADSSPFVDTGRLVVIRGNYRGTRLRSVDFSPDCNLIPR